MKDVPGLFASAAALVLLLVLGAALHVVATLPPDLDPSALPSVLDEPPDPAHRECVEEGRGLARAHLAAEKLPGLSLAVAVDGRVVWAEAFRCADLEQGLPATPRTLYRIGALTEVLTATALGRLLEGGRIELDAAIRDHLPDLPPALGALTPRQLLGHTSGLRDLRGEAELFRGAGCEDDLARLEHFQDDPLRFEPGSRCAYSFHDGVLLGAVLAAASGESYLELVRREVLGPLGLEHTLPDSGAAVGRARPSYPRLALDPRYGLEDAPDVDLSCLLPAAGFLSTPSDLVRLACAWSDGSLLRPTTLELLLEPVPLASGEASGMALGWIRTTLSTGPDRAPALLLGQGLGEVVERSPLSATSTGGQVPGGTASLLLLPEERVAVAVTTSVSGAAGVPRLALDLARRFLRGREE